MKLCSIQTTGAQEWHIVPLLGDVTSPTTAVPYSSMTSEFTCSEHREALAGAPTAHDVHKQEFTVQGGSTQLASEQVGRLRCITAVDGGIEAFPFSIVICAPLIYTNALPPRKNPASVTQGLCVCARVCVFLLLCSQCFI